MMRTLLIGLALVAGCKGAEPVVTTPPPAAPARPFWVGSRPVSDAYYVGVGLAAKARPDFQETAKKNALNDLASEISVRVEGNSLLYTLDRKTSFSESFTSNIRTSTSEQLEGFELVDTWEN
ncbi:MAG: LPP20 family lipoprotein, partial [Flavobacteriales bacterium]|nr:LPP20 family lipoprotein [Flavobacteriales bacterium]